MWSLTTPASVSKFTGMSGRSSILLMLCGLLLVGAGPRSILAAGCHDQLVGFNHHRSGFRVWAPNATAVAVRGQSNNWGGTAMTKDNATDYWTATVANARPNQEYQFFSPAGSASPR